MSHAGSSSSRTRADAPQAVWGGGLRWSPRALGFFLVAATVTIWLWDAFFVQVPFALLFAAVMMPAWVASLGPAIAVAVAGSITTAVLMAGSGRPPVLAPAVLLAGSGFFGLFIRPRPPRSPGGPG